MLFLLLILDYRVSKVEKTASQLAAPSIPDGIGVAYQL